MKTYKDLTLPDYISDILTNAKDVVIPKTRNDLLTLAMGGDSNNTSFEVSYEVKDHGTITEADVTRCKNGIVINYTSDYMRRRDPDSMLIGDNKPSDKPKYSDVCGSDFSDLRTDTFNWLKDQELIFFPFRSGSLDHGYDSVLIAPANAGFFAAGLADLQYFLNIEDLDSTFTPRIAIYLAPPFRHTHFNGK